MLTGAPGFPGTDRGGMFGLLPGGAGAAAGVGTGSGAAGASTAGAAFGTGDVFSRFSASLFKREKKKKDKKMNQQKYERGCCSVVLKNGLGSI